MIRLYYINHLWKEPEWEHIDDFETEDDMWKEMKRFWKECGFTSYYQRGWLTEDGYTMIDFGSHYQFYKYKEVE